MNIRYQENCENINWELVPQLLTKVGMSCADAETHRISFENSFAVIFVFDGDNLIGFGRAISDGVRQSAVYDIAIEPTYQGQKIGQVIMEKIMAKTPNCNFILYAAIGKEGFYKKLGFLKMKTGMARFRDNAMMIEKGFAEE